jgi:hypothetical protein
VVSVVRFLTIATVLESEYAPTCSAAISLVALIQEWLEVDKLFRGLQGPPQRRRRS